MHLEYDSSGQPRGKWRGKYGTQIGLCIRKLSILLEWDEVPEGLQNSMWEDTVNLFHIEPDEAKKEVFLSAVAERFKDFKAKLVSGWISLRRERTKARKMKMKEAQLLQRRVKNKSKHLPKCLMKSGITSQRMSGKHLSPRKQPPNKWV